MQKCLYACALVLLGCGGDDQASPPDATIAIDAAPDAFVTPFTLSGTVGEPAGSGSGSGVAIADASICMTGLAHTPCTTSANDGSYTFDVTPSLANVTQVTTATGHLSSVFLAGWTSTEGLWVSDIVLLPNDAATTLLHTHAGFTFPTTTTGFVEVFVGTGTPSAGAVGATASLAGGSAPVYLDANGVPDPALTAVTSSGLVLLGNLAPATYQLTVTAPGKTCIANSGGHALPTTQGFFAPTGTATAGVAVIAGALTSSVNVSCN